MEYNPSYLFFETKEYFLSAWLLRSSFPEKCLTVFAFFYGSSFVLSLANKRRSIQNGAVVGERAAGVVDFATFFSWLAIDALWHRYFQAPPTSTSGKVGYFLLSTINLSFNVARFIISGLMTLALILPLIVVQCATRAKANKLKQAVLTIQGSADHFGRGQTITLNNFLTSNNCTLKDLTAPNTYEFEYKIGESQGKPQYGPKEKRIEFYAKEPGSASAPVFSFKNEPNIGLFSLLQLNIGKLTTKLENSDENEDETDDWKRLIM